jgi:hypothetical protein
VGRASRARGVRRTLAHRATCSPKTH